MFPADGVVIEFAGVDVQIAEYSNEEGLGVLFWRSCTIHRMWLGCVLFVRETGCEEGALICFGHVVQRRRHSTGGSMRGE